MNAKTVRNTVFHLHRILGLAVGLVLLSEGAKNTYKGKGQESLLLPLPGKERGQLINQT